MYIVQNLMIILSWYIFYGMMISQKVNITFNNDSAKKMKKLLKHFCPRRYLPFDEPKIYFIFAYVAITQQIANTGNTKKLRITK